MAAVGRALGPVLLGLSTVRLGERQSFGAPVAAHAACSGSRIRRKTRRFAYWSAEAAMNRVPYRTHGDRFRKLLRRPLGDVPSGAF